ncbi:MAG TPA: acyl carrier protein [Pantanalinema sp.]
MDPLETYLVNLLARSAKVAPEAIGPDADLFMDLGIDSLEGLKVLAQIEERYGVLIPDHELMEMNTLGKIRSAIERAMASREA